VRCNKTETVWVAVGGVRVAMMLKQIERQNTTQIRGQPRKATNSGTASTAQLIKAAKGARSSVQAVCTALKLCTSSAAALCHQPLPMTAHQAQQHHLPPPPPLLPPKPAQMPCAARPAAAGQPPAPRRHSARWCCPCRCRAAAGPPAQS